MPASESIFIGIAREADVGAYLNGVAHAEVRDIDFPPFRVDYREHCGDATPIPPRALSVWTVLAQGSGRQSVDWPLERGTWNLVVMNADGSAGIDVELSVGAKIGSCSRWALPCWRSPFSNCVSAARQPPSVARVPPTPPAA